MDRFAELCFQYQITIHVKAVINVLNCFDSYSINNSNKLLNIHDLDATELLIYVNY